LRRWHCEYICLDSSGGSAVVLWFLMYV
jgi:hypothetical protein